MHKCKFDEHLHVWGVSLHQTYIYKYKFTLLRVSLIYIYSVDM